MESEVRRYGGLGGQAAQDAGGWEYAAEAAKRLLADAMPDDARLKDLWQRSGAATGRAESCCLFASYIRDERTAGV